MQPSEPAAALGRLHTVAVREIWPHEALNFTPWLLENADVLSDVLRMDLELHAAEHPVGDFSLDLVGVDTATGERVIVENQLERSDHLHLGQILTYAGGTDPVNIVWVAPEFREEHRAAIDWLNSRTDERTRFFAVVVSVVRIGTSPAAPLLRLVAEPNDWGKSVKTATGSSAVSSKSQLYQRFWQIYVDAIRDRSLGWTKSRSGPSQNWMSLSAGISDVSYGVSFGTARLRSEMYFGTPDTELNNAWFAAAEHRRAAIERAYGETLEWEPLPDRKGSRIAAYFSGSIEVQDAWPEYVDWFLDSQRRLRRAVEAVGGIQQLALAARHEAALPGDP